MSQLSTSTSTELRLTRAALNRDIVQLAVPAVLENLLVTMVFFADTLLIGWLKDPTSLAAVGLSSTFMWIATGLFQAIAVGATALVARAWGARQFEEARNIGAQAILLGLVLGGVVMVVMYPLADDFLVLMGGEPEVVSQGSLYLRLILLTSVFSFPQMVVSGIMRGAGDTRRPMQITLLMNVWNVFAAYALIFGPGPLPAWRLAGAGVATSSARMLSGCLALFCIFSGRTVIRVPLRYLLHWDWRTAWRILRLSLPNVGETLIARTGHTLFYRIISALGTASLAAHQIAVRVESLSFMPGWGLTTAATTLVGQALGAGKEDLAEESIRRTLRFALGMMGAIGVVLGLFGRQLVVIFGATPEVLDLAGLAVRLAALEQPGIAMQMVIAGSLRGAGDTRTPMLVTLVGVLFFRVAVVYLFAIVLGWGLAGVWLGTAVDWTGRAVLMYSLFRRGTWKATRV
ncbi:MAG: MATE family efflux transporter [Anaerolineae bacterium]|nr:MATE family efflux transporter [Anaerolineae bacterium]